VFVTERECEAVLSELLRQVEAEAPALGAEFDEVLRTGAERDGERVELGSRARLVALLRLLLSWHSAPVEVLRVSEACSPDTDGELRVGWAPDQLDGEVESPYGLLGREQAQAIVESGQLLYSLVEDLEREGSSFDEIYDEEVYF
jgi:hypothetical protein